MDGLVSSSFGSIDLAGFAKASAYWYRCLWYYSSRVNSSDSGYNILANIPSLVNPRPYADSSQENAANGYNIMMHIVEKWGLFQTHQIVPCMCTLMFQWLSSQSMENL